MNFEYESLKLMKKADPRKNNFVQCVEGTIGSFGEGDYHGNCTFSFHEKKFSISNKKHLFLH